MKYLISGIVVAAIILGGFAYFQPARVGGVTHLSGLDVGADGFTYGTTCSSVSSATTTVALTVFDIDNENCVDVMLTAVSSTLSFPASSTLSMIVDQGKTKTVYIRNATTTAATSLTITGGTGVLLKKATSSAVVFGDTDGANYAKVELTRKANSDIEALLSIFTD